MDARRVVALPVLISFVLLDGCAGNAAAPGASGTAIVPALASSRLEAIVLGKKPHFVKYIDGTGTFNDVFDITAGPEKSMWFTANATHQIGRVDKAGHVSLFPVPTTYGVPVAITTGPDGNLWFTMGGGSKQAIGKMTPAGTVTQYPFGHNGGTELGITSGPDGNIWFTDYDTNQVGKITTAGAITEYPIPAIGLPLGITTGPDGNLWICEEGGLQGSNNSPGRIFKMTTSASFTGYLLTPQDWTTMPEFITTGPDGNLWFTENDRSSSPYNVESITTSGTIAKYALPNGAEPDFKIAAGPDGNLWITELESYVDSVTTSGVITRYMVPNPPGSIPAQPRGIAANAKDLYFAETTAGYVGVFNPR
jgi:streptogramin lyase